MKEQATRCTQKQLAYIAHWKARGFTFKRGDKIPLDTMTPPGFAASHPIADSLLGGLVLGASIAAMLAMWITTGAGL